MSSGSTNLVVGIDLGGTNMQVAVVEFADGVPSIRGRHWAKTLAAEGQEAVIDRLVDGVHAACASAEVPESRIEAVGVAAPGAIDIPNGVVLEAPNLGWDNVPLRDILHQRLGCRVALDNDVNAAVWAEQQLGAGRGCDDLLGVWVGTGVGGGLVLGGRVYHGPMFTAGEIGQTIIMPEDRPGKRTVEDLCSRSGMSRLIDERAGNFPKSILHHRSEDNDQIVEMSLLMQALENDDPLVTRIVQRSARLLGVAIANWVTVLSLDRVIIGGGVTEAFGRSYISRITASFNSNVFPDRCKASRLVMTELAGDAGILGAALMAWQTE